jgi:hypothetical protein
MCWSTTATAIFASIYFVGIVILILLRQRNWIPYSVMLTYFMSMELYQFSQWSWGDVGFCTSSTNRTLTYFSFVLVMAQPTLFSFIGLITYGFFPWLGFFLLNSIGVGVGTGYLVYNSQQPITTATYLVNYFMADQNLYNVTCTVVGPNGHLLWYWASGHHDYQMNFWYYIIGCLFCFVAYSRDLWVVPFSWFLTLAISLATLWNSKAELASYWCMLSVISVACILTQSVYWWHVESRTRTSRFGSRRTGKSYV